MQDRCKTDAREIQIKKIYQSNLVDLLFGKSFYLERIVAIKRESALLQTQQLDRAGPSLLLHHLEL